MRVALVHDYLNQAGGAEKVAEELCRLFPDAPIYTSVYDADAMPDFWRSTEVRTTFMQRLSPSLRVAKRLLPLYPSAFESLDLSDFDLVLSSCSTFSKGVITPPETLHVCYCHNTTRFAWMYPEYVAHERLGTLQRTFLPALVTPLRVWDYAAAQRVDHFIANSRTTARRIATYYRREARVIEPPIDASAFAGGDGSFDDYYVLLARLQSYKRLDLAVEAASTLGLPLKVIGSGPDERRLRAMAGPTVEFSGRVSDAERVRLLQRCAALIVPGREDFGLTALEAQAAGRPVIAFRAGGSLETVVEGITGGILRRAASLGVEPNAPALDPGAFDPQLCRKQAARFDVAVFAARLRAALEELYAAHAAALRQGVTV